MTSPEEYLSEVGRSMLGMDRSVRGDILRELKSHIADATAANGGNLAAALMQLGSPGDVGRRYRDLYGYGRPFQILFVAIAFLVAVPSVPILFVTPEGLFPFTLSLGFLAVVAAWILWVSVAAGSRVGLRAGLAAFLARALGLGVASASEPAVVSASGLALFFGVSLTLIVLGWAPGRAKKAWTGPRTEL